MKKTLKKALPILLIVCTLLSTVFTAYAIEDKKYGEGVKVKFDEDTGVLVISGTGELTNLYHRDTTELTADTLVDENKTVKHIIIEDGITSIVNCFNDLNNLQDVSFPETLENIEASFIDCDELNNVTFPSSLKTIGVASFNDCDGISTLYLNAGLDKISSDKSPVAVFNSLDSLSYVFIPAGVELTGAFSECKALAKIVFEDDSVQVIQGKKFSDTEVIRDSFCACHEDATIYVENTFCEMDSDSDDIWHDPYSIRGFYSQDYSYIWDNCTDGPDIIGCQNVPDNVYVSGSSDGAHIDWESLINVDTYHVYRRNADDYDWEKIAETKYSYYNDQDVEYGVTYYYHIKTDNNPLGILSEPYKHSHTQKAVVESCVPASSTSVKLSLNGPWGTKAFYIYRSETGKAGSWTRIKRVDAGHQYYTITGLTAGKKYYFCVKPIFDYYSTNVGESSAKVSIVAGKPMVTDDVSYSYNRDTLYLEWLPMSDAKSYRVYVRNKSQSKYTTVETIYNSLNTETTINWKSKETIYVKIRVFYKDGSHEITDAIKF